MKKIIILELLLFLVGILSFQSCKKENTNTINNETNVLTKLRQISIASNNQTSNKTTSETFDFSNPNNPYEWVGIAHNNSLDYVAGFMNDIIDDSKSIIVNIKQPYSSDVVQVNATNKVSKISALTQKYFNETVIPQHPANDGLTITSEQQWSNSVTTFFFSNKYVYPQVSGLNAYNNDIWVKLTNMVAMNSLTPFEANADSIIIAKVMETNDIQLSLNVIKDAEGTIISSNLSDKIKAHQLEILSILRNSIGYWATVMQDTTNPWWQLNSRIWNITGTHTGYARWSWNKFWETVVTGIADALGTAAGGPTLVGSAIVGGIASGLVEGLWP